MKKQWLQNNIINIIIAVLIGIIGWGGREAFIFFKKKMNDFERWHYEDLQKNYTINLRIYKLEISDSIQNTKLKINTESIKKLSNNR